MWWEERKNFPAAFGFIRTQYRPGSPDANISVIGGPDEVWQTATELISAYEQNVYQQNNANFRLRHIKLLENIAGVVATCPSPHEVSAASAPPKFSALGVCLPHNFIGEIWYILRVETAGNAFYWRLDITERFTPWFRSLMALLCAAWFLLFCFIGVLVTTLFGMFPLGVFLLPIALIWAFLTKGSQDSSGGAGAWGTLIWPLMLFENTRQDRLDHALTYAPAISGALQEAVDAVEQSAASRQKTGARAARTAPSPQSSSTPSTSTSTSTQTTPQPIGTTTPSVQPIQGKLRH